MHLISREKYARTPKHLFPYKAGSYAWDDKHISGRGLDIASDRYSAYQLVGVIKSSGIPYTQLIPYADGHVHIAI